MILFLIFLQEIIPALTDLTDENYGTDPWSVMLFLIDQKRI